MDTTEQIEQAARDIAVKRPDVGIYRNVPNDLYQLWDCASAHRLSTIVTKSPEHLRCQLDNPEDPTPAIVRGDALHVLALQPELFDSRFVVAQQCAATKKGGDKGRCSNPGVALYDSGEWLCGVHARGSRPIETRRILSQEQYDTVRFMVDALHTDKFIHECLTTPGETEFSVVWEQPIHRVDGKSIDYVRCKMRADKVCGVVLDLKSTRDASPEEFRRAMYNFGYHRQGAMYLHGLSAHEQHHEDFLVIAVEPEPPYARAVYRLTDADVELGWKELASGFERYAWCEKHGVWPGYGFNYDTGNYDVCELSLPTWAHKRTQHHQLQGEFR